MREWLSWRSPVPAVWIWHAIFDGSRFCPCEHSRWVREYETCRRVGA